MTLGDTHRKAFLSFYRATSDNQHLDRPTTAIVGLAAAMALGCRPCMEHYLKEAEAAGCDDAAIGEVEAKVMAVAAGKVRAQFEETARGSAASDCCD